MATQPQTLLCVLGLAFSLNADAQDKHADDPHYVAPGFFDLHVCHWPNRPLFFMALFSTTQFAVLASVEVFDAKNKTLGTLDLKKFEVVKNKQGQEKRVFISHFDVGPGAPDGWYTATIRMHDGAVFVARDLVQVQTMPMPGGFQPANHAQLDAVPTELRWNAIPGARYYQVTIRDAWVNDQRIFKSKLLTEPRAVLPPDLLRPSGSYTWRVHARDVNEDKALGDFNLGTMGPVLSFTVAP